MKRTLAAWLPNWPLQRLAIKRPELAAAATSLYAPSRRGQVITACCAAASAAGVRVDMPLAEATVLLEAATRNGVNSSVGGSLRESRQFSERIAHGPRPAPQFHLLPHDQAADRTALEKLAQWCHRFSPSVGWEMAADPQQGNAPDALLLDATNLGPLFGGEAAWAAAVAAGFERLGLQARIVVADSPAAALAVAKFPESRDRRSRNGAKPEIRSTRFEANPKFQNAKRTEADRQHGLESHAPNLFRHSDFDIRALPHIIPSGQNAAALAPLPPAALRLAPPMAETLQHLGVECVGQLLALPRDQLQSRLGPEVLWRIDQALGRTDEPLHTVAPPPEATVERLLEFPLADRGLIEQIVAGLIEQLAWQLARRNSGALAVACRLECVEAAPAEFTAGLYQPTADPRQIGEIIGMQLERLRLAGPVEVVSVTAVRTARLGERQRSLFDGEEKPRRSPQLAGLVNRLASRLGEGQVVRYQLQRDPQPEHAFRREPLVDVPTSGHNKPPRLTSPTTTTRTRRDRRPTEPPLLASSATTTTSPAMAAPLDRPWQVLPAPQPLEVLAIAPEGPPARFRFAGADHQVARHWGPERIETGWQRRRLIRRDYYRVETTTGVRAWLFRRRGDGGWFLHGWFD